MMAYQDPPDRDIDGPYGGLTVCTVFSLHRIVLNVEGYLDIFTGSQLMTLLSAVISGGHLHVVLDLSDCHFLDTSGLRVIDDCGESLSLMGGQLTIRSPSRQVLRLLALTDRPVHPFRIESPELNPAKGMT